MVSIKQPYLFKTVPFLSSHFLFVEYWIFILISVFYIKYAYHLKLWGQRWEKAKFFVLFFMPHWLCSQALHLAMGLEIIFGRAQEIILGFRYGTQIGFVEDKCPTYALLSLLSQKTNFFFQKQKQKPWINYLNISNLNWKSMHCLLKCLSYKIKIIQHSFKAFKWSPSKWKKVVSG